MLSKDANEKGVECPKCGCKDLRVFSTRKELRRIKRVRVCRCCGAKIRTYEMIELVTDK